MNELDDPVAAAAFRRLIGPPQHRTDVQNVDLTGLAGFCRDCLGGWLANATDGKISSAEGREFVYGMSYAFDYGAKAVAHVEAFIGVRLTAASRRRLER